MSKSFFTNHDEGNGILRITAPMGEQIYVIMGSDSAAVVDTGMGVGSLREYIDDLTGRMPLVVINTHGHPDHAGGNIEFDDCRMHTNDRPWYEEMCSKEYRRNDVEILSGSAHPEYFDCLLDTAPMPLPIEDGDIIELGGRTLRIIHTPGHTPGSVCVFDCQTASVFAGDSLSAYEVWLYDRYSESVKVYYNSLVKLKAALPEIRRCFTGHSPGELPPSALGSHIACARHILMHDGKGTPRKTFAGEGYLYTYGGCGIIYRLENLY